MRGPAGHPVSLRASKDLCDTRGRSVGREDLSGHCFGGGAVVDQEVRAAVVARDSDPDRMDQLMSLDLVEQGSLGRSERIDMLNAGVKYVECALQARRHQPLGDARGSRADVAQIDGKGRRDGLTVHLGTNQTEADRQPLGIVDDLWLGAADPDILGGTLVFKGTRVPVQSLFDHLKAGDSIEVFLDGFPSVKRSQVLAVLKEMETEVLAHA